MTWWIELGTEFWDDCAHADLSDAATRTHAEAIGWLYRVESSDHVLKRSMLQRFAGTRDPIAAMAELVAAGFWRCTESGWVLAHHGDVVRQSLAAQQCDRDA